MKTILQSRNFWTALFTLGSFWLLPLAFHPSTVFDIVNSLGIAALVGVCVMYLPTTLKGFFRNDLDGEHYLVIGLSSLCVFVSGRFGWNWYWRSQGKPDYLIEHPIVGFLIWGVFVSACLILLARDVRKGEIPRENFRWIGLVVAGGVALSLLALAFFEPSPEIFR